MIEELKRPWTLWNYHSFVRDLSMVVVQAEDDSKEGVKPPDVPEARGSLPRPARYGASAGVGQPAEAVKERLRYAVQLAAEAPLVANLKSWTADRFQCSKYDGLVRALDASGPGPVAGALRSVFFIGEQLVLESGLKLGVGEQVWVFNLKGDERKVAAGAFPKARELAQQSYNAVCSPDGLTVELLNFYFNGTGTANRPGVPRWSTADQVKGSPNYVKIKNVFEQTNHEINRNPCSIVLGPGEPKTGDDADTLAYAGRGGASAENGSLIHLCPKFFQIRVGKPSFVDADYDRGCTVFHEATHLFAETEDVKVPGKENDKNACYGRKNCFSMKASLAAKNADSFCLFAVDLYHLKLQDAEKREGAFKLLRTFDLPFFSPPSGMPPPPPPGS